MRRTVHLMLVTLLTLSGCGRTTQAQVIYDALRTENTALLDEKLAQGVDVNGAVLDGWTPLPFSVANGKIASAEWLIGNGADVDSMDGGGNSALFWAVKLKNERAVRLLTKNGADPCLAGPLGETAVSMAMANGQTKLAEELGRCGM
jgi:ankyrin repeat protein